MRPFQLAVPTRIYFGTGITHEALEKEKAILEGNLMVVTTGYSGGALMRHGHVDALIKILRAVKNDGEIMLFCDISANPKLEEVECGAKLTREQNISAVIGFGGGSAIDAAKAIAVGVGTGIPISEYLLNGAYPAPETLPVIAVPTTAGSGSELSRGAILTCTKTGIKTGIRGSALYPKVAIVDPVYTYTVPYITTMETGFDVIAHAVESYISQNSNLFTQTLSKQALQLAAQNLPLLAQDLTNKEAREWMSYSSMVMGINLGNVGTALPHRLQYPVGALTDTSHAAGLSALYPAWITCGYEYSRNAFNCIGSWLGDKQCHTMEDVLGVFQKIFHRFGISHTLRELFNGDVDISLLMSRITGSVLDDPASIRKGIVFDIYQQSL